MTLLGTTTAWDSDALSALRSGSILQIRKVLAAWAKPEGEQRPLRISIVRTFTIEAQVEALKLALCHKTGRSVDVHVADLDVIEPELFDAASQTLQSSPDAVVVLWRLEELFPDLAAASGSWEAERRRQETEAVAERLQSLVAGYRRHGTAPLFLSTFSLRDLPRWDASSLYGLSWAIAHLNATLYELSAKNPNVYILDTAAWERDVGSAAYDEKMDCYARQPVSRAALGSFALFVAAALAPLAHPPAKVLAIDLDNVLWGGVLGEEGVAGVAIGHDYPGNVYRRIQERARVLRDRGVLLALVSKNDLPLVEEAFASRPEMVLKLGDFSAVRVNWQPKHENLQSIAEELNLGIDSFVFVDDQPFEQDIVRYHLPAVRVLECNEDPLSVLHALTATDAFDVLRVVDEDRVRVADYAAQRERKRASEEGSVEDFLRTLNLEMKLAPIDETSIERAHQMLHKTNQFNVTTPRHSRADLERMISDGAVSVTLAVRDRFGDQGIVGLTIATLEGDSATVDTFLMSCRALGRGAEDALWAELVDRLFAAGARTLHAHYVPTTKNAQVAELFSRFGMALANEDGGRRTYRAKLPLEVARPDWIRIVSEVGSTS